MAQVFWLVRRRAQDFLKICRYYFANSQFNSPCHSKNMMAFRFISINKELSVCLALMLHGILVRIVGLCRVPVASFQMRRLSLASTDGETGRSPPNARGSGDHELDVALDFALIGRDVALDLALIGRDVALDLALIGRGVHLTHTHSAPRHPRPQCELVSEAISEYISEPGGEGSGEGSGEHCSGRWLDGRASSSARHRSAIACISARRALALPKRSRRPEH